MEKTESLCLQTVQQTIEDLRLSTEATEVIKASFAGSTLGQYDIHLRKFQEFCVKNGHETFPSITCSIGVEFLTKLYKDNLSYSTINSARSAISQFATVIESHHSFGTHPLVTRFMKGIYKLRPPKPKYNSTWDVKPVLQFLETMDTKSLKSLTLKCATLIAITTGQRVQTLSALSLKFMTLDESKMVFAIRKVLKTSRPGRHTVVEVHKFTGERSGICPLTCLKEYIRRTKSVRNDDSLFVSFLKPNKAVGTQTISRWIALVLKSAGVDVSFGAHSVRHASSSKAASLRVPIDQILSTVGWSSEAVFAGFYRREIRVEDRKSFAEAVLSDRSHQS